MENKMKFEGKVSRIINLNEDFLFVSFDCEKDKFENPHICWGFDLVLPAKDSTFKEGVEVEMEIKVKE
jgi:hypothetical protein